MRFRLFGGAQFSASNLVRGYNDYLDFLPEAEALGHHGCFLPSISSPAGGKYRRRRIS